MAGSDYARFQYLVRELCDVIDMPDAEYVISRGAIEVDGFEVLLTNFENDPIAMYLNFHLGIVTPGRTLRVFRLMLEANLSIYAQDQAQMGLNPDTGGILLLIRVPMGEQITGIWLAETLTHYAEHGRYWLNNVVGSTDELFEGICSGDYFWLRA
jgi:hypothetical protein